MVSRPNQEPQIRHQTPQADHGPDASKSAETHRRPILPAEDRAGPYGYSPEVDQTAGGRSVLVVLPIQTDPELHDCLSWDDITNIYVSQTKRKPLPSIFKA